MNNQLLRFALPLIIFAGVTVSSLLIFGIDIGRHTINNLYYFDIFSYPEKYNASPLVLVTTQTIRSVYVISTRFVHDPPVMIAFAVFANTIILFFCAKIVRLFLSNVRDSWIFVIILGLAAASPLRGLGGGFTGTELVFTSSTLANLFSICAIYCFLSHKSVFGATLFSLAVLLHSLNSISLIMFFLPGYYFYRCKWQPLRLTRELLMLSPLIGTLAYGYFLAVSVQLPFLEIGTSQWYQFILSIHVDDVLLLWSIYFNHILSALVIALGAFLSIRNKRRRDVLDVIVLTNFLIVITILCIETVQILGLSLAYVTELITPLQFRRGLWFIVAVSLLNIYREISGYEDSIGKQVMIGLFVLTVLNVCRITHEYSLVALIILTVFLIAIRKENKKFLLPMALILLCLLWPIVNDFRAEVLYAEYRYLTFLTSLFLLYLVVCKFVTKRGASIGVSVLLLVSVSNMLFNATYRHGVLSTQYRGLYSDDFGKDGYTERLIYSGLQTEDGILQYDVLKRLNSYEGGTKSAILFNASALGYSAPILSTRPILLSRWDNTASYSKSVAGNYFLRLKDLGISDIRCGEKFGRESDCLNPIIDNRINELGKEELELLSEKYRLGFVVRTSVLSGYDLIYKNTKYYVYKL